MGVRSHHPLGLTLVTAPEFIPVSAMWQTAPVHRSRIIIG
jgi:hypothetical protein